MLLGNLVARHFLWKATVRHAESWAVGEGLVGNQSFERVACGVASIKGGDPMPTFGGASSRRRRSRLPHSRIGGPTRGDCP